jgi:ArsR family transcriptional regulator
MPERPDIPAKSPRSARRDRFRAPPERQRQALSVPEASAGMRIIRLDVRPPEEYAAGHLPGAVNIAADALAAHLKKLPRGREVVAYCRGPYCLLSVDAVAFLRERGYKARRLVNGFPEWKAAGLPVET